MLLTVATFVRVIDLRCIYCLTHEVYVAMVFVDNKVALRQLEIANSALLSRNSLRAAEGESIAKDGKFHPRVLTLVST